METKLKNTPQKTTKMNPDEACKSQMKPLNLDSEETESIKRKRKRNKNIKEERQTEDYET